MSCPHSKHGTPSACSQCLRVAVRRVELTHEGATVDGVVQPEPQPTNAVRRWKAKR